jgi:hypothetical protein
VYEITVLEGYTKINDLTGIITVASRVTARVADLRLADTVDGTYMWTHSEEESLWTWYICTRAQSRYSPTGQPPWIALVLMEDKLKEQVASLELGIMSLLCGNSALHTHFPKITMFAHKD